jgi:hypothetical protein
VIILQNINYGNQTNKNKHTPPIFVDKEENLAPMHQEKTSLVQPDP